MQWPTICAWRSAIPSTAPVCERSSIVSAASSTIGCRRSTTVRNWTWSVSPRCTTGRWARLSSGDRQLPSDQLCWRRSNGSANNSGDTTLIASHVAGWIDLSIAQSVRRRVGPSARVRILRPRADNKGAAWWRLAVSRGTRVADSRRPRLCENCPLAVTLADEAIKIRNWAISPISAFNSPIRAFRQRPRLCSRELAITKRSRARQLHRLHRFGNTEHADHAPEVVCQRVQVDFGGHVHQRLHQEVH